MFFFSSPPSAVVPLISPAKERLHAARHSHDSRGLHKRIQVWLAVGLSRSTDICMMMTLTLQCACMDCKPITTCCNHIGISDDTFLSSFDCPVIQRYFSHHPQLPFFTIPSVGRKAITHRFTMQPSLYFDAPPCSSRLSFPLIPAQYSARILA